MKRKVKVVYCVYKDVDCEVEIPNNLNHEDICFEDFQTIHNAIQKIEDPTPKGDVDWEIWKVCDGETKEVYWEW